MALVNGAQLDGGKYTVEEQLGQGRFCITYLVRDSNDERFVIKTLNYDLPSLQNQSPAERDRLESKFLSEAIKLERCRHPHIVKVQEIFQQDGQSYLVMEYLSGYSLAQRSQKVMREADALLYIQQIGEALSAVHEQGLIHRDVKPGNIMICDRAGKSEAILIDFGLALDFERDFTTARTQEAAEGYAPPELYSRAAQKGKISPATDVYSLAATLYDLLTGQKPTSAIKLKIDNVRIVPPQELNEQISDSVNQAILAGMKLEPEQRPQSIREWLDLLESINVAEQSSTNSNTPNGNQRNINWVVIWAAIAAIGTLLAGMAGWIPLFQSEPNPSPTPSPTSTVKQQNK